MNKKRVTISDLAKATGYSKTAISFAFNSPERISKETAEKILKVAKELDYIPDPMARNFSLGRHMTIGFLLPQSFTDSLSNPYTQAVLRGIGIVAESNGYTLTIIPPLHSSIKEAIKNAAVDGLISMGLWFDPALKEALRFRRLPMVVIDGTNEEEFTSISIDDIKAAEEEMNAVLTRGHRDIAVISLPYDAYAESTPKGIETIVRRRQLGYKKAFESYNIEEETIPMYSCQATYEDGKKIAKQILEKRKPSCFVTMSDIVAYGVIAAIREKGFNVPEDISVIGFDGIREGNLTGIDLTTIVQDAQEKGILSANLLFSILEGKETKREYIYPFSFHEGETLKDIGASK